MESAAKLLGNRIRSLRTAMGVSQEELSFKAGISAAHLGQIERAVKKPTIETIGKIAYALDVPIVNLFESESDPAAASENSAIINKIIAQLSSMSESQQRDVLRLIKVFRHFQEQSE